MVVGERYLPQRTALFLVSEYPRNASWWCLEHPTLAFDKDNQFRRGNLHREADQNHAF